MFEPTGDLDWTFYLAEITKAKAAKIRWCVAGFFLGIFTATGGFVILVQYLQNLP